MIGLCVLINVILLVLADSSVEEDPHNPGFFLKMAKSIPRIGRRSGTSAQGTNHWTHSFPVETASGGDQSKLALYRKVVPFEPNMLFDVAASSGGSHDLKFVSWKDFDIALESDVELFEKLAQLAKSEADLNGVQPVVEYQQFVPMYGDNGNRFNDDMYYRFQRSSNAGRQAAHAANLNKERIAYQTKK